jgi:exopolyphosphatase/guanosine-5'-triphosphate,3'-diphosphate pyrophosphatase
LIESLNLGCVTFSQDYIGDNISAATMNNTYLAACAELEVIRYNYRQCGWDVAFGSSGTMKAVAESLPGNNATINKQQIDELYCDLVNQGVKPELDIPKPRRDVLPAGIAIIKAIFDQLQIDTLNIADAALKEGLIYDMIGRLNNQDARSATVKNLMSRYHVDISQAKSVAAVASALLGQLELVEEQHTLISPQQVLEWAAQLHEIGLSISHSSYHDHGHYLLRNCDMAGFSRLEQHWLAQLVRMQRKKIPSTPANNLPNNITACLICLRMAVLLCRSRQIPTHNAKIHLDGQSLNLSIPELDKHPLTHKNLLIEKDYLQQLGLTLVLEQQINSANSSHSSRD